MLRTRCCGISKARWCWAPMYEQVVHVLIGIVGKPAIPWRPAPEEGRGEPLGVWRNANHL
eukprot:7159336-Alexandrium_andersonii.AAC.1